jgi:hypothetical protein
LQFNKVGLTVSKSEKLGTNNPNGSLLDMKWSKDQRYMHTSQLVWSNQFWPLKSPLKKSAKFHGPSTSTQCVLKKEHYRNYWATFINELDDQSQEVATAVTCTFTAYLPNLGA